MLSPEKRKPIVHPSANAFGNQKWTCEVCGDTYGCSMLDRDTPRTCKSCSEGIAASDQRIRALQENELRLTRMIITLAKRIEEVSGELAELKATP